MRFSLRALGRPAVLSALAGVVALLNASGCGGGGSYWESLGTPFGYVPPGTGSRGPGSTGRTQGGRLGQSDRTPQDPCDETQARKFVTISMRNLTQDYIHYFFVAIAFVDVDETAADAVIPFLDLDEYPDGAVCASDVGLYRQFGYQEIAAGAITAFGDYCIGGPALLYYHREGQFRRTAGAAGTSLGSAIAPAQGISPTYDTFFTSAGARVPVPDVILFHNPGTGGGAALKISRRTNSPCEAERIVGAPVCERDAFYYVDEVDLMTGTTALGVGSGRRVPNDIQGTACECSGLAAPFQVLAPSGVTAPGAECYEFLRRGRIEYVFLREDENPPFPQLVWKVTDTSGSVVHEFDSRAGLP